MTHAERLDYIIKPSRKEGRRGQDSTAALMSALRDGPNWNQSKRTLPFSLLSRSPQVSCLAGSSPPERKASAC